MHGFADVQHGVEDDRVPGDLQLVSAGNKQQMETNPLQTSSIPAGSGVGLT